jgi:5'-deoxynucleotidase YfbR-like HD superfamily hydrolase
MSSTLCFGTYSSLLKEATGKSDNNLVELLFKSIEPTASFLNDSDCNKWRKGTKKLPLYITSPTQTIDFISIEKYFKENVLASITNYSKKQLFHKKVYSLFMADSFIEDSFKNEAINALINKNYANFHAQVFLYCIMQSNDESNVQEIIDNTVLQELPEKPKLEPTINSKGFERAFKPVKHKESLNLKNNNFIRLFRLDIESCSFIFDNLNDFLEKNIGMYVLSRAKRDKLIDGGHIYNIGKKAVELLKKAAGLDNCMICEELGDIILYTLIEYNLNAPKIYNKIQLIDSPGYSLVNQGGVHLLTLDDNKSSYEVIIAKSNIVGDLRTAIDNAFNAINSAKDFSKEYKIIDASILDLSFSPQISNYLRNIIIPSERKEEIAVNTAFSVFLGYSLGINPESYSASEFVHAAEEKMIEDIKTQIEYIKAKINKENLSGHSFYFYVIPFNDADCDKVTIMQNLLGGNT